MSKQNNKKDTISTFLPLMFFTVTQQRAFKEGRVIHERMWLTFTGFPSQLFIRPV